MGGVPQARLKRLGAGAAAGVVVGIVVAAFALWRPEFLEHAELAAYDQRVKKVASEAVSDDIVFIDVGDEDIIDGERNWGITWPWPRAVWGYVTDYTATAGARAVVFDWVFQDRGVYSVEDGEEFGEAIRKAGNVVIGLAMARQPVTSGDESGTWGLRARELPSRQEAEKAALRLLAWDVRSFIIGEAPATLYVGGLHGSDAAMAMWDRISSVEELKETLGIAEDSEVPPPEPEELTPAILEGLFSMGTIIARRDGIAPENMRASFPEYRGMREPLAVIGVAPKRTGVVSQLRDDDGVMRRHIPFFLHEGRLYPSLAVAAFLASTPEAAISATTSSLELGGHSFPLDGDGRLIVRFDKTGRYKHIKAYDVLRSSAQVEEGETPVIDPALFKGKVVIISAAGTALRDNHPSAVDENHPGAEIQANVLENLIAGQSIRRLGRGVDALMVLLCSLIAALAVMFVWGAIRRVLLALVATFAIGIGLGLVWWQLSTWLLGSHSIWIAAVAPMAGIGASAFAAVLTASASERRSKRFVQEALGRYTSPALVAELTEHPEHLSLEWGEVRQMSVYFSDIAGFTSISEGLEPRKLVALLNEYLTSMTDIILQHDGVVDKYIGDAIMAFWGAPIPDKDHASKAVRCAIAMRKKCDELRPAWLERYGERVFARAGVNSGEAVVGNMGSAHKYNYTVMGDMVNLAARLEGANKPYGSELMISEYTLEMLEGAVAVRELDLLAVKGKEEPVRVFEVLDLEGEVPAKAGEVMSVFAEGLELYRERDFVGAEKKFESALALNAEDGPSKLYADRCRHFIEEPPADDWDGVWRMKTK